MLKKLGYVAVLVGALAAPMFLYPVLLMKILCFALFACAFNLLIGFTGLLSFGHAAFFGGASYIAGHALKVWGVPTELGLLLGVVFAALMGLVVIVYSLAQLGRVPTLAQWLGFAVVCLAGLSVHYSLMFLLACISFWTVRAQGIVWGYYNLFNINK